MEQPAPQDPFLGAMVGNYRIKEKLGEGGMGSVYMAEHPLIGKQVALKVLRAEYASNEEVITRFFNEAKAVNDIRHPNIVDIIDYGMIQHDGRKVVYFIMEFLDGLSLAALLRQELALPLERALAIGLQVADALGASHSAGIVHRDLKPDNIILIQRGRERDFVKLLDFGIAKLTGDNSGTQQTRTGMLLGTPAYMSPEQCEGLGHVDHRTDVYALGILLYKMTTGTVPFQGAGYGSVLMQHITQVPARPSTIRAEMSPHVELVIMKALEKRPDARYPTMEEFMKALADPVGYVEAHGGMDGFLAQILTPSATAWPAASAATLHIAPGTPVPGTITAPGSSGASAAASGHGLQPSSAAAGRTEGRAGSRRWLVAAMLVTLLALAGGGILLVGRGGDTPAVSQGGEGAAGMAATELPAARVEPDGDHQVAAVVERDTEIGERGGAEDMNEEDSPVVEPEAAPEPATVSIEIGSVPIGAAVFVGQEEEARGTTPLTLALERGEGPVTITLKRNGYRARVEEIRPDAAGAFEWKLARERGRSRPPARGDNDRPAPGRDIGGAVTLEPAF